MEQIYVPGGRPSLLGTTAGLEGVGDVLFATCSPPSID